MHDVSFICACKFKIALYVYTSSLYIKFFLLIFIYLYNLYNCVRKSSRESISNYIANSHGYPIITSEKICNFLYAIYLIQKILLIINIIDIVIWDWPSVLQDMRLTNWMTNSKLYRPLTQHDTFMSQCFIPKICVAHTGTMYMYICNVNKIYLRHSQETE